MAVPKYNELMLPLLKRLTDSKEHLMSDLSNELTKEFQLSEADVRELLPSGKQAIFPNRMGWARTYLKKAGLVDAPRRGAVKITARGLEVLKSNPKVIDQKFLQQFPEFKEFQAVNKEESEDNKQGDLEIAHSDQTPQELFEYAYKRLETELSRELLQKVQASPPFFFEQLVVDLLINMGYGGSRKDAGEAFATSGDGGIDGTIKEDKLGLTGVSVVDSYQIKKVDTDYFQETEL